MPLAATVRPPSLVEKTCQQLAELARRDRQDDDGWLPTERALSAKLGVSRSVVREAVKRLEMQGMLEIRHGIGIKAVDHLHKPLTAALELLVPGEEERLRQLVEMRFVFEPENARLASATATDHQLEILHAIHHRLEKAESHEAAVEADMDFHCAIAAASGNQIAKLLMFSLCDLLRASLVRGYHRVTTESSIREHSQILKAIARRAPAAAAKAMTQHIQTSLDELALKPVG